MITKNTARIAFIKSKGDPEVEKIILEAVAELVRDQELIEVEDMEDKIEYLESRYHYILCRIHELRKSISEAFKEGASVSGSDFEKAWKNSNAIVAAEKGIGE